MAGTTKYVEYANKDVVDKLAIMSYSQFQEINEIYYREYETENEDTSKNPMYNKKNQFTAITELCRKLKKNNYCITNEYNRRGRKEGRRYAADKSLQCLWKIYRNAILRADSVDFDMKNAHPTILLALCKLHSIPCKNLKRYVEERNEIISEFADKDALALFPGLGEDDAVRNYVKTDLFISSINYDKQRTTFPKHKRNKKITYDFFIKFGLEILEIQKEFIKKFPQEFAIVKSKGSQNLGGRLMSYLGCKYEDILLKRIEDSNIKPSVLMYDGFLMTGKDIDKDDIIEKCNEITKDFGVSWDDKYICTDILNYIENLDVSKNSEINIIQSSCLKIAEELLLTLFKDRLFNCHETHYFKSERGWLQSKESIFEALIKEITDNQVYMHTDKDDVFLGDVLHWCRDVITFLLAKCETNDDLMNQIWEKTIRKIYFINGFYDFNTLKFEPNDKNSFINITRDLTFERNKDIENEIYSRVLNPIFTIVDGAKDYDIRVKLRDAWLKKMSRIMAGYIEDKDCIIQSGERNCGKGLLSDMLKFAFEDYVGSSNSENFILKNRNDEEAKKNMFMFDFQFKRLIVCNEVSLKEHGATAFDGNLIKKAHSGGDFIEMRQLYKNKTNVRLQSTVLFNLNDIPVFHPSDTREKIMQFDFNSKFIKKKMEEKDKFTNIEYINADDSVKTEFIKRPEVRNEFVLMLIDAFQTQSEYPEDLRKSQAEDYEDDDGVAVVLDLFELTKNDEDRISNKEMKSFLKKNNMTFSFAKVKKLLLGKGCNQGNSTKEGGRYISGLKRKDTDPS